ncbi:glycosyltransferase family 4 protein [Ancylobacter sp. 6x-1]|uniref:Glycosyltransferase family 4 protein n=1 Tax=Ancylobacter crimeensis TaxID=2579147 RepID=A0ABT0DAL0_9HYPH|nr:glycosyltransferase family 1 protein [Ancylobacter crimeensis]MCK0196996.1 glycosyltransferase family 4 protein [Ancylobacter crimeensis]
MKAVLDITRLLRRAAQATPTGIDRVELAYARHLLKGDAADVSFVARLRASTWYLDAKIVRPFIETQALRWRLSAARVTRRELSTIEQFLGQPDGSLAAGLPTTTLRSVLPDMLPPLQRLLSPVNLLPSLLRRHRNRGMVYLNVSHEGLIAPGGMRSLVRGQAMQPVFLVHDLIPLTHPEYVRPGDAEKHQTRMRTVLESARAVICNSRDTQMNLASFARARQMPLPPAVVSPLGIEDEFGSVDVPPHEGAPFFIALGTIEPRKNHLVLLHAWRALVEKLGPKAPKLLIIGRRGWENENVIDIIERSRTLSDHVLECNRLPDAHLRRLMRQARAVLLPSFTEGFGLPLFEALALRVPVICSNLPVFRDIAGATPCYLDPIDGIGWARVIEEYARPDSVRRPAQLERLSTFQVPRWSDHFKDVDQLIDSIATPEEGTSLLAGWLPSLDRSKAWTPAGGSVTGASSSSTLSAFSPHESSTKSVAVSSANDSWPGRIGA